MADLDARSGTQLCNLVLDLSQKEHSVELLHLRSLGIDTPYEPNLLNEGEKRRRRGSWKGR